jgi:hypothetical protein
VPMQYAICVLKLKIINKPSIIVSSRHCMHALFFARSFGEGRISRSLPRAWAYRNPLTRNVL